MMRKFVASFILVFCLGLPAFGQVSPPIVDSIEESLDRIGGDDWAGPGSIIRKVLDSLANKKNLRPEKALVVVLGNFTYAQSGLGSPFSRFLEDQFSAALVKCKYFSLFPRDVLSNLPVGLDSAYRKQLGGEAATGSLSGKFSLKNKDTILVDFQVVDLERGQVIGYDQITVPVRLVPKGLALEPPPPPSTEPPAIPASRGLAVSLTTDRGASGTYFDGEEMTLSVFANRTVWLKIYQIDTRGEIKLIFPNAYSSDNKIPANQLVRVPQPEAGFAFKLGAPYGVETIRAVVSNEPFRDQETAFESLGPDVGKVMSRGLSVQSKQAVPELAQAQVKYTVNPR